MTTKHKFCEITLIIYAYSMCLFKFEYLKLEYTGYLKLVKEMASSVETSKTSTNLHNFRNQTFLNGRL